MKRIGHRNLETYVRSLISESFDSLPRRAEKTTKQKDSKPHACDISVSVQSKKNRKGLKEDTHGRSNWNRHKNGIR